MSTSRRSENGEPVPTTAFDPVLYGQNTMENVVAVQQLNESTVRLYVRSRATNDSKTQPGQVTSTDVEFFPFFFLSTSTLLENYPKRYWLKELAGPNFYRYLVAFPRWNDLWEALRFILINYNKTALKRASHFSELEPLLVKLDPLTQYLLQSGVTLFKGMSFDDLHRVQISIQTYSKPGKRSDPRKTEDRILALALTDNLGWEETFDSRKMSEEEILVALARDIATRDPDVIEGHELFDHTLPYLVRRAELLSTELNLGRDASGLKSFSPRGNPLEPDFENAIFELAGRHLIDTKTLAHGYSISKRAVDHYGLRYLAQHFGFSTNAVPQMANEKIATVWADQPHLVLEQAKQDCRDVNALSNHLSGSNFFQTRMVPLSYDALVRAGSASKIELMMLREYIRQKHSVPKPQTGAQRSGAYTDIFVTGILDAVLHADIESLYPSIMLSRAIKPSSDELGTFLHLLRSLTTSRLEAKRSLQSIEDDVEQRMQDAFQSSLKILINSFYGYLGYTRGLFNDFEQADRVTSSGQELLRSIIRAVGLYNGKVIEADTDGIYFIPPDNVRGEEQELIFVEKLSTALPDGIHLAMAGRYKKMLSYRMKNYALLDYHDRLTIRGSSLISRSLERFAKNYIRLCIECLLQEDVLGLHKLFVSLSRDIADHRWDVQDFCRTETLRDSVETYEREIQSAKRKPTAAYEVRKRSGSSAKPGDRIAYYVTGTTAAVKIVENCRLAEEWEPNFPDENTAYYLDRLKECSKKFEMFFEPEDFTRVFSTDDLFGFNPDDIHLLKAREAGRDETSPGEDEASEFGIWLDESI
jgi:DNA polymerase, archaea type